MQDRMHGVRSPSYLRVPDAQEQGDTYQGITSIVAGRINYPTVSFATDNGTYFLHFGSYIHFTYGRSVIFLPILASYIAQGTVELKLDTVLPGVCFNT